MFHLDDTQCVTLAKWLEEHDKTCVYGDPRKTGACGGRLTYEFTPNSLGMVTHVKCACGEHVDETDWDW